MKKLIAMLTAVVMITASLMPISALAAFSDVDDSNRYKDAITTLSTLSVISGYEDGTFRPDGAITRAEFTKLIVFMLGFEDLTYSTYTFDDVDPAHWARNYIQTAYDRGIIAGFEDDTFRPEDPVTYAQALKMVVCTLGYEPFALVREATGEDWANKYIQQATELSLQKNITGTGYYEDASRGLIAQMLYNALEVPIYENNGYMWVKTDKTLLGDFLKVKELKGTLIGVGDDVTEDCSYTLSEEQMDIMSNSGEQVLINYSSYTSSKFDITKYLGSKIIVYYRQVNENDERELISIDAESTKNSVIELEYDDINNLSGTTLKYYDSNLKSKTIKLKTNDMTVRYNGKNVLADETVTLNGVDYNRQQALEQWLNPDTDNSIYGTVSLTDTENDGTVDMIQIYDYKTLVALSAPSTTDYRITDKLVTGTSLILDPQSSDYTYSIKKDGAEIPVTSIAANDVVLYAWSLDGSLCTLLVSNKTAKGTVSSISSNNERMTIDNKTYNIGSRCESYIREKNNKELKVGVSGTFYIDDFNTAVYGTLEEAAVIPYAYITNLYTEDGKNYVTVYAPGTNASQASSYPLKSTTKVNGTNYKAESAFSQIRTAAGYAGDESKYAAEIYESDDKQPLHTEYAQPARVSISNGEITSVVLLTTDEIMAQNEDKEKIVQCKELEGYTYSSNSFSLDNKTAFSVNSNTVVIYVPRDRSLRDKYARKTVSSAFTANEKYYLEAYDLNASKIAGLIILYGDDGTLTKIKRDTDYSIVASLPENTYSSVRDDTVQKFDVYAGTNTTKSWTTYNATDFSKIQVGDVIQFEYDSDNLAQKPITNILFSDVADVLDTGSAEAEKKDKEDAEDEIFDWTDKDKFEYTFKNADGKVEEYDSSTLGKVVPYSMAAVYNVSQVLLDENKLYVTTSPFEKQLVDDKLQYVLDDSSYEEITISSSTKIIRMEDDRKKISKYVADTTAELHIGDFKDAKNYGTDCSKILVCSQRGIAKLIMIYQ